MIGFLRRWDDLGGLRADIEGGSAICANSACGQALQAELAQLLPSYFFPANRSRNRAFNTFPVLFLGNASMNSTYFGFL